MLRETQQPDIVAACDTLQELSEAQELYEQLSREIALHDLNKLRMLGFSDQ